MNEGLTRKEDLHEGQEELRGEEREAVLPAGTAGGLQPDRLPQSGRRILVWQVLLGCTSIKKAACGDTAATLAGPYRLRPLRIPAGRCPWTELQNFAGPQSPRKSSGRQAAPPLHRGAGEVGNTF